MLSVVFFKFFFCVFTIFSFCAFVQLCSSARWHTVCTVWLTERENKLRVFCNIMIIFHTAVNRMQNNTHLLHGTHCSQFPLNTNRTVCSAEKCSSYRSLLKTSSHMDGIFLTNFCSNGTQFKLGKPSFTGLHKGLTWCTKVVQQGTAILTTVFQNTFTKGIFVF